MPTEAEGRDRARHRVADALVEAGISPTEFARKAEIDADTVVNFLNGRRWPQAQTRNRIATTLGWTSTSIDRLVRGEEPQPAETVGDQPQDAGVLLSLPPGAFDGLSLADREEALAAAKAALLERAREIRRRLES